MCGDPAASQSPAESSALPQRRARSGPEAHLLAALSALGEGLGRLLSHNESPWASVTFSGARHSVVLEFAGVEGVVAGEVLIDALPEHPFTIPGQLVADAAVIAVEHTALPAPRLVVGLEVLLLEDA